MEKKSKLTVLAEIFGIVGVIAAIVFALYQFGFIGGSSRVSDALHQAAKEKIQEYYRGVKTHDPQQVKSLFAYPVQKYYLQNDYGFSDIVLEYTRYYSTFPYTEFNHDWDELKTEYSEAFDGSLMATIPFDYCVRRSGQATWDYYRMTAFFVFNDEMKITSVWDEKRPIKAGLQELPWK